MKYVEIKGHNSVLCGNTVDIRTLYDHNLDFYRLFGEETDRISYNYYYNGLYGNENIISKNLFNDTQFLISKAQHIYSFGPNKRFICLDSNTDILFYLNVIT